jgi:hypothetical protein
MSINKNFVVRHGFEASTDLILADADTRKVGIGTTRPVYDFTVAGGIGATDFYLTGIGTFVDELNVGIGGTVLTVLGLENSIGIGSTLPAYLLDIRSPVSTGQTALYVQGDVEITGGILAENLFFNVGNINELTVNNSLFTIGVSTFLSSTFINSTLEVSGITTLGSYVTINDSVNISDDLNVVGLTTLGSYVTINDSVNISDDLNVVGLTTLGTVEINAGEIDVSRIETGDLSVTGIATLGTVEINAGEIDVSRIETGDLSVTGIATLGTVEINAGEIDVSRIETGDLSVTGIATLGTVEINAGIITATSGIVTYYGDGQYLDLTNNSSTGIGIGTTGGLVGYGITFIDFYGAGVSTAFYDPSVGIATIFFEGSSGTIGIGTEFPIDAVNGDLFYSAIYGRIFVYYDENEIGVGTDEYWVDAAPFNTGFIDIGDLSVTNLTVTNNTNLSTLNVSGIVTAIDFNSTSDITFKENIQTVENALETVSSLRGVSFNWKETGKKSYGVIAQELKEVLPDLVSDGDVKTVNYNGIIGVLIESIKELKIELEKLKNTK